MAKTTSFALGPENEAFLREEIASGDYSNASEVVREALRRMREYKRKRAAWDRLIAEGIKSAETEPLLTTAQVRKSLGLPPRRARKAREAR